MRIRLSKVRPISTLIAVLIVTFAASAVNAQVTVSGLAKPGVLTICNSNSSYPPMYYIEGGELVGLEIDLIRALAGEMNLTPKITRMSFDGLIPALNAGRCDVALASFYITDERLKHANAIPYMIAGVALGVPKGNPLNIRKPDDLSGKTIAIEQATVQATAVKHLNRDLRSAGRPQVNVQYYRSVTAAIHAVKIGKAQAFGESDIFAAKFFDKPRPDLGVLHAFFSDKDEVGIFYENPELADNFKDAMAALRSDGVLKALFEKYHMDESQILSP